MVIATPEHWHLQQVVDACAAGKDVYIEKPLTRTIEEGPKMISAAKRYDRIVEVGSQWICSPIQKRAKELLQSGVIGTVTNIVASYDSNSLRRPRIPRKIIATRSIAGPNNTSKSSGQSALIVSKRIPM